MRREDDFPPEVCTFCGEDAYDCECPECPVCGEIANPGCGINTSRERLVDEAPDFSDGEYLKEES